jgi:peroxiredoxin
VRREALVKAGVAAAVTLGVVGGYWYVRSPESTLVKVGQQAPDLELPSLGGSAKTKLSGFRGRPVLLVMFMSGCHICESEIDTVERLHRELLQKGLVVLGVAVDKEQSAVEDFVRRHEITFIVLRDPDGQAVRAAYGSWKMPEAYLMDARGQVSAVYLGSVNWTSPWVRDKIKGLLPPSPRPAPSPMR